VQMKKNRPGLKIVAIAPWRAKDAVIDAILAETTSFGVRYWPAERRVLSRELPVRQTRLGPIRYKMGFDRYGRPVKASPEYEDVKRVARKSKRPLVVVYQEALANAAAWLAEASRGRAAVNPTSRRTRRARRPSGR